MNQGPNYSEHFYKRVAANGEFLKKNAHEYPFSSFANFLLLYHYKKTANNGFDKLAKKTALQFENLHWLELQLFQKDSEAAFNESSEQIEQPHLHNDEHIIQEEMFATEIKEFVETNEVAKNQLPENRNETTFEEILPALENQSEQPSYEDNKENINSLLPGTDSINEIVSPENEEENDPIAFEPLHTVDYFASQGIKINDELITNDKLGSQMKSFTAWLKSMKKLHPGRLAETNIATEKLIQTAAEESNVNTEVLTEAMAEVLIKQDKKEKAIEMFTKLSLINPSKSAYFAAKIESIKSS